MTDENYQPRMLALALRPLASKVALTEVAAQHLGLLKPKETAKKPSGKKNKADKFRKKDEKAEDDKYPRSHYKVRFHSPVTLQQ